MTSNGKQLEMDAEADGHGASKFVNLPEWITEKMIADTILTWQPYYESPLTKQDAIEMLVNVGQLFNLLEADHAREKNQASKST